MIFLNQALQNIQRISEIEFSDIVDTTFSINCKLRIVLSDKSFVDVGVSQKLSGRFSFHWQRHDGSLFRYDNFPDTQWNDVSTFPYHFHHGSQHHVVATPFSFDLIDGFRQFMEFVRNHYYSQLP